MTIQVHSKSSAGTLTALVHPNGNMSDLLFVNMVLRTKRLIRRWSEGGFSAFYTNSTILEEKVQHGAMGDEARCNGRWSTLQRHMHRCEF